jgi:hypothetical protein
MHSTATSHARRLDWHLSDYRTALAEMVNVHHALPFSAIGTRC